MAIAKFVPAESDSTLRRQVIAHATVPQNYANTERRENRASVGSQQIEHGTRSTARPVRRFNDKR